MDTGDSLFVNTREDQFIVLDWGDKVDCGIGLSYRPVRLHTVDWLAGTTTLCNS